MPGHFDGRPFDPSKMVYFFKTLETVKRLYEQQKYMYDNKTHSLADRIISLGQPYLSPIVRWKAKSPVEFGVQLDISVANRLC